MPVFFILEGLFYTILLLSLEIKVEVGKIMVLTGSLVLALIAIGVEVIATGIVGLVIWELPIYSVHRGSGE